MQELLCKDTKQCRHQSPATKPAANYKSMSHYAAMSAHLAAKGKVPEGPAVISLSSLPWREGDSAEVPSKGTCASTAAGLTALPAAASLHRPSTHTLGSCFCLHCLGGRYLGKELFLTPHTLRSFTTHPQKGNATLALIIVPPIPTADTHKPRATLGSRSW